MRKWIGVVLRAEGALRDAREHLLAMAAAEDSLSKAKSFEDLHYQRGKVDGIKSVLFLLSTAEKEG